MDIGAEAASNSVHNRRQLWFCSPSLDRELSLCGFRQALCSVIVGKCACVIRHSPGTSGRASWAPSVTCVWTRHVSVRLRADVSVCACAAAPLAPEPLLGNVALVLGFSILIHPRQQSPAMASYKTYRIKRFLAKKQKQNRPIPQWIRMKTGNTIRYNSKRRHWRRTKLGL